MPLKNHTCHENHKGSDDDNDGSDHGSTSGVSESILFFSAMDP